MSEQPLPGRVTPGLVRVGDTVRRPTGPWTPAVDALLLHLEAVGFVGAPRALGQDRQGRQVLEHVPGEAGGPSPSWSPAQLRAVGGLLADLHLAAGSFVPPAGAVWDCPVAPDGRELVCHGDPAPWNLVASARGWVLVDWDAAGPATALWELAYTAQTASPLEPGRAVPGSATGLRALVDGYGLDEPGRRRLVPLLARRAQGMVDLLGDGARTGRQPWARLEAEDGAYWRGAVAHVRRHEVVWERALLD